MIFKVYREGGSYRIFEAQNIIVKDTYRIFPTPSVEIREIISKYEMFDHDYAEWDIHVATLNALTEYIGKEICVECGYRVEHELSMAEDDHGYTDEDPYFLNAVILMGYNEERPTIVLYDHRAYILNENGKTIQNCSVYNSPGCD